jgi:hypothetical protein
VTATPGWSVSGGALAMDGDGLHVTTQSVSATAGVDFPCTMWVEFKRTVDTGASETYLQLFADANNRAAISVGSGDVLTCIARTGGVQIASITPGGALGLGVFRAASRIAANSFQAAVGGVLGTEDTAGGVPTTPSAIHFGHQNGANFIGNAILRAAIIASGVNNAGLQAVTPP